MNILFDLIPTQTEKIGGVSEYIRSVFIAFKKYIKENHIPITIYAFFDDTIGKCFYKDLNSKELLDDNVVVISSRKRDLGKIVEDYDIDKIFIGALQFWIGKYDFSRLNAPITTVIHDMHNTEIQDLNLYAYLSLFKSPYFLLRQFAAKTIRKQSNSNTETLNVLSTLSRKKGWDCITVSNYTKSSLLYFYPFIREESIKVLSSPERQLISSSVYDNKELEALVNSGSKYFLLTSADRPEKNASNTIAAYTRFRSFASKRHKEIPFLVTIGQHNISEDGIIPLPFLSESDLVKAYQNCYALIYPSFFEGFGYPPIEAMKYGKPVLASNVTSIPEVLGSSAIYFSPYYRADIFNALRELNDKNYDSYVQKAERRYEEINRQQKVDLVKLLELLSSPD